MALPRNRRQLKDWALRKLGSPVIDINISSDQCEDRLCEALDYFASYHYDGVEEVYLKHKITASVLHFSAAVVNNFEIGETLIGLTSGAKIEFIDKASDNLSVRVQRIGDIPFVANETIKGQTSGTVAVLRATDFFIPGDIDNEYIPVGDDVISVTEILPLAGGGAYPGEGIWNVKYQFHLNNLPNLVSSDIISYDMFRKHLTLLDFEFNSNPPFGFARTTGKITLQVNWGTDIKVDEYVIVKASKVLNPADYPKVYSEWYVRELAYLLFKLQWGNNLKKYEAISLIGGVTLNGQKIYDEAKEELERLEERLQKEFQLPVGEIFLA